MNLKSSFPKLFNNKYFIDFVTLIIGIIIGVLICNKSCNSYYKNKYNQNIIVSKIDTVWKKDSVFIPIDTKKVIVKKDTVYLKEKPTVITKVEYKEKVNNVEVKVKEYYTTVDSACLKALEEAKREVTVTLDSIPFVNKLKVIERDLKYKRLYLNAGFSSTEFTIFKQDVFIGLGFKTKNNFIYSANIIDPKSLFNGQRLKFNVQAQIPLFKLK